MGFGWGPASGAARHRHVCLLPPRPGLGRVQTREGSDPRSPELASPPCTVRARTSSQSRAPERDAEDAEARGDALRGGGGPGTAGIKAECACCGHGGAHWGCPAFPPTRPGLASTTGSWALSQRLRGQGEGGLCAEAGALFLPSLSGPLCLADKGRGCRLGRGWLSAGEDRAGPLVS